MNKKIGVLDSGIGGLTTLDEITKLLPNEDYIYYADSKNNPYGEKTKEELFNIVDNIVKYFLSEDVKLIVIACNTATTKCIEDLRKKYKDVLFVGTEPAIKVACDNNYKNTLVMATPGTIDSDRTHELITKYRKSDESFILLSCEGLANAIEKQDADKINNLLNKLLKPYEFTNIDAVVLGCTHYPLISELIKSKIKNAKLIDGNIGVAKRVKSVLTENNLLNNSNKPGTIKYIKNI
jgi:glutamate racemase